MADASEEKEVVLYISAHGLEPKDDALPDELAEWKQLLDDSRILNEQGCRGLVNFVTPRRYIQDFFTVLNEPHQGKTTEDILIEVSKVLREQKKESFFSETTPLTRSVSSPYMKLKFIMDKDNKNKFVYDILKTFRPDIFHHIITFQPEQHPQTSSGFSGMFKDIYTGFSKLFKSSESQPQPPLVTYPYQQEQSYIYQPRLGFKKMIESVYTLFLDSEKIGGNDKEKIKFFFEKLQKLLHTPITFTDFSKVIDNVYRYFKGPGPTYQDMTFSSSCHQSFKMQSIVNEKLFFMYKLAEKEEHVKRMNYGIYLLYDSDTFLEHSDKINLLTESSSELGISYVEPFKRELLTKYKSEPIYLSKILLFFFKRGYKVTIITNSCRSFADTGFEIEKEHNDVLSPEDVKELEDYTKYIKSVNRMNKRKSSEVKRTAKFPTPAPKFKNYSVKNSKKSVKKSVKKSKVLKRT